MNTQLIEKHSKVFKGQLVVCLLLQVLVIGLGSIVGFAEYMDNGSVMVWALSAAGLTVLLAWHFVIRFLMWWYHD